MKVLLHLGWGISSNFVGGTERFVINLGRGIIQRGDEAFIVCSNLEEQQLIEGVPVYGMIPPEYKSKIKKYGYANEHFFKNEIIGQTLTKSSLQRFSTYVSRQIEPFKADVFHLNAFIYSTFLSQTIPLNRTIVTNHENPDELVNYWGKGSFSELLKSVHSQRSTLKQVSKRIVPSRFYASYFSERMGMEVDSIPLGIDTNRFSEYRRNEHLRTTYAPKNEMIFLLPSRFDINQKGHDIALRALAILKKEGLAFKCIFSGYDSDTYAGNLKVLEDLLNETKLEQDLFLTRFDDMLDAYGTCDIVLSPERFCSYGLSISESLALGIPTIMTPIPTYIEIASRYNHAYFTEDFTPEALKKSILHVIQSGFGPNFKEGERFRRENAFDSCVDKYHQIYRQLKK